jgi:hypothetical protein
LDRWPDGDRRAWDALFVGDDPLEEHGAGRHWAAHTRTTNRQHYARWLGWLSRESTLEATDRPWERATPELVRGFADDLVARAAPCTCASGLVGLKVVL